MRSPSRLHFGLLARGPRAPRQFGGVGLMIEEPGLDLSAEPANQWQAEGPRADRALRAARQVARRLEVLGMPVPSLRIEMHEAPPEHVGLGVGTQIGLAMARIVTELVGLSELPVGVLAELAGRGLRSGIGLHGFALGGLIVDGGHRTSAEGGIAPLVARLDLPADWSVLVVIPPFRAGLNGPAEVEAFAALPPMTSAETDRLCRLVLLGLLPAAAEADLFAFGAALTQIQALVGRSFAPIQGGPFARPELAMIADVLRAEGLHGVGQSSWGPTLYGFSQDTPDRRLEILEGLRGRFGLDEGSARWTRASSVGSTLTLESAARPGD